MTQATQQDMGVSDEKLVQALIDAASWQGAAERTGYMAGDVASSLDEDDVQEAKVALLAALARTATPAPEWQGMEHRRPSFGAVTPEMSPWDIVHGYYRQTFSKAVSDNLTRKYFAALPVAPIKDTAK